MTASRPSGPARPADSGSTGPGGPAGPDPGSGAGAGPGDGAADESAPPPEPEPPESDHEDSDLLTALLDGMDAALCAFDADGVITHWNREAERILGWTADEAVGRRGFAGWAIRTADAADVEGRLLSAMTTPGRQVHEFALVTKEGGRVLLRTQSAVVRATDGRAAGVYCAFSEVHAQIDLERSIALSEALFEGAEWGVVLVDVDLRPAVANAHAARALHEGRTAVLGRPLGDLLSHGVEELESAFQHVLAEGAPPAPSDLWVTVRGAQGKEGGDGKQQERRCWRSRFLRLGSPLAEEPVPLGVGWFFEDVTDAKLLEQESSVLRFRANQLHRAGRAAAECEDPTEAATVFMDFALVGFADHALLDLVADGEPVRLVRAAATPAGSGGPCSPIATGGIPVRYIKGHPALQAVERNGPVRTSEGSRTASARTGGRTADGSGTAAGEQAGQWARDRQWPEDSVHALCVVLRSRGRTLGVATFLRSSGRRAFERADAEYAEDVADRAAAALDLARQLY
ncbi:PAS domain-containing protein [Streptomyces sp. NPDC004647]|uniref:PAS domain-containing protein n=1 Tax=Streptomyces sp. NPDC004647 TaxID=3154671 RepID=UPI0033A80193